MSVTGNQVRWRGTLMAFLVSAALTSVRAASPDSSPHFTRVVRLTAGFTSARTITPRFSPDGKRIVFNGRRTSDRHDAIYLVNPDGTGLTRLFHGDSPVFSPAFAPDGASIIFNAGPTVYEYDLATDCLRPVISDAVPNRAAPVYSRDGRRLLYCSNTGLRLALRVGSAPTGDTAEPVAPFLRQVTAVPDDRTPAYSPDGSRIVCAGLDPAAVSRIYLVSTAGNARTLVTPEPGDYSQPAWSPDGGQLVYSRVRGRQQDLCVRDLASGRESPFTADQRWANVSPDFSPDGSAIVFVRRTEHGQDVYLGRLSPRADAPAVESLAVVPDSGLATADSLADTLASDAVATPEGRSRYRIVIFAEEPAQAHALLRQLKKLGYDHPDNYATTHPANRLMLKHNQVPEAIIKEITDLARQYLVITLIPVDEPNAPENTIYINLP